MAQRSAIPSADGRAVYERACSTCHDGEDSRAPARNAMAGRSPRAVLDALTSGAMRFQGLALSGAERRAVAEYVTGRTLRGTVSGAALGRCARMPAFTDPATAPAWNGWGPAPAN